MFRRLTTKAPRLPSPRWTRKPWSGGSDAGDEYEAEADEGLASVFINPRRERTVEHVVAEVVDAEQHEQGWRSGDDVSDAHVLSEHASGSTGHTAAADPAGTPPESHPYGQAHRP